jgi:hypothetical protein
MDAALWAYGGGARWHTVTEAGNPACGGMLSQASGPVRISTEDGGGAIFNTRHSLISGARLGRLLKA